MNNGLTVDTISAVAHVRHSQMESKPYEVGATTVSGTEGVLDWMAENCMLMRT